MQTNLQIISSRLKATMQTLPYKMGVLMVGWSKDRFKYQNWIDTYPEAWQKRSRNVWKNKGKAPNNVGRALLVKSGRLRRSIRIVNTTSNSVTIGSDVPYARVHNEGERVVATQNVRQHIRMNRRRNMVELKGRRRIQTASGISVVKAHTRKMNYKMPERRFMGKSMYLTQQLNRLITAEINKIFR